MAAIYCDCGRKMRKVAEGLHECPHCAPIYDRMDAARAGTLNHRSDGTWHEHHGRGSYNPATGRTDFVGGQNDHTHTVHNPGGYPSRIDVPGRTRGPGGSKG